MTGEEFRDHTIAVIDFLQDRGISEEEACSVMGNALSCMVSGTDRRKKFVEILKQQQPLKKLEPDLRPIGRPARTAWAPRILLLHRRDRSSSGK